MGKNRKWIQITILLAIVVIGAWTIAGNLFNEDKIPKAGDEAPGFKLAGLDGQTHKLSDYEGKGVIVNFWGSYCEPCRNEMPALQRQSEKWAATGLTVLGLNVAENKITAQGYVDQVKVKFPILLDQSEEIRRKYGVIQYPTTFFIKPDGKVHTIKVGEMTESYIDQTITAMLGK
ncbi:thiol-disulfide oxidoreductase ResA [Paenibacillus sp. MBLB4367]|uniref:thiol-disulfide oxidoreductase ResA n=1 Tax=Paenibacillus sp. MBLB4367 TaxID=3384767 RepID=UPI0039083969